LISVHTSPPHHQNFTTQTEKRKKIIYLFTLVYKAPPNNIISHPKKTHKWSGKKSFRQSHRTKNLYIKNFCLYMKKKKKA